MTRTNAAETKDCKAKTSKTKTSKTKTCKPETSKAEPTTGVETPPIVVTLAALEASPPRFTPAQRARLEAMGQDEIDAKADADPINPTWSDAELERAGFARRVREARAQTGLSQPLFAERFHIALSRLRDWERARFKPDSVAEAYIRTILANPKAVERALAASGRD